ncbi:MAG: hypothetical protein LBT62_05820 [Deltaproteobacteria bacterium]|jgi:asparagine synthase (glutamine-hydrolysing)|nr:hypothetical protein [Deltaproteobacteria bacterium]
MTVKFLNQAGLYTSEKIASDKDHYICCGCVFNPPKEQSLIDFYAGLAKDPKSLINYETDIALAYHQADQNRVVLLRDAAGITPLFYARHNQGWAFATNLDDLFKILGGPPPLNELTFFDFVATHYRHVFRDPSRTFHQGVNQVPAGSYVILNQDKAIVERWFNMPFDPQASKMTRQEASERYVSLLDENVKIRLKALEGERYTFTVSSGMDSAAVCALADRSSSKQLETWFIAYRDQSGSPYDETAGVEALIKETGWKLNRIDLTAPDLLSETTDLIELTKAPIITVTWLAHYVMAQRVLEQGYDYLFSGLGGDESLAGEFEHFFVFFADLFAQGETELLEKETQAWIRLHDHPVFKKSPAVRDDWFRRNIDFNAKKIKVDQNRYLANRDYFKRDWYHSISEINPPIPMPTPFPYFLSNRLFQEMNFETSPPTLWSEALSSRAAGVKGIFPMTSPRLLSLALSLPGTFKYEDGVTKMLLRRALKGILPDCSRLNPVKTGFNAPLDLWLREKKLNSDCFDLLNSASLLNLGWISRKSIETILKEHLTGAKNHMMLLWPLICTAIFVEKNRA